MLPHGIPNDDLIAKCSPRGLGNGGNVVWSGYLARGYINIPGLTPAPQSRNTRAICMAYEMEHWASRKLFHRTIEEIIVTNLFCGYGKGWDVIVYGTIIQHEDTKSAAQGEAEKLLEGKC
jgi:hypothetical protein